MVEAKLDYETDYALMVDDWWNIRVLHGRALSTPGGRAHGLPVRANSHQQKVVS